MTYNLKLCKDGQEIAKIPISEKAALKSEVLEGMLESCDCDHADIPIPYKWSVDTLKKYVEYCEYASELELVDHIEHRYEPITGRDLEFCESIGNDFVMIKELFGLADFLGQHTIKELLYKRVAHHFIRGHCSEDVLEVLKSLGITP